MDCGIGRRKRRPDKTCPPAGGACPPTGRRRGRLSLVARWRHKVLLAPDKASGASGVAGHYTHRRAPGAWIDHTGDDLPERQLALAGRTQGRLVSAGDSPRRGAQRSG